MTATQLQEVLAKASNREDDYAARWGTKGTNAYYLAWEWVTGSILGRNTRLSSGNPWEPWQLESIQHTINKVQSLVALED